MNLNSSDYVKGLATHRHYDTKNREFRSYMPASEHEQDLWIFQAVHQKNEMHTTICLKCWLLVTLSDDPSSFLKLHPSGRCTEESSG